MSIFRGNTTSIGRYNEEEIPVIEGYNDSSAYLRIISEATQNEQEIFDNSMFCEFNELAAKYKKEELENLGKIEESTKIEVVSESISDLLPKLKKIVMTVWQKIRSLYEAAKVAVTSFLTKDYNKFYEQHKNVFKAYAPTIKGNYKFKMPKRDLSTSFPKITSVLEIFANSNEDIEGQKEKISNGEYYDELLRMGVPGAKKESFKSDFYEWFLGEEKSYETLPHNVINEVEDILGSKDMITALNNANEENNKFFKNELKGIDHLKNDNQLDGERYNIISKKSTIALSVINLINGEYIKLVKFHIAQCKAIFTKVVARSKFTEQTLLDAIEEVTLNESLESLNA